MEIRLEQPEDIEAIRHVNELAFGRPNEADLIDRIRESGTQLFSLVATYEDQVIGHAFFTPVSVEGYDEIYECAALGPIAVLPQYQRHGVGSTLINIGLQHCSNLEYNVVFVLGDSAYYSRFGFETSTKHNIKCQFDVPEEAFMVAILATNALEGIFGTVYYLPEFSSV